MCVGSLFFTPSLQDNEPFAHHTIEDHSHSVLKLLTCLPTHLGEK